MNQAIETQKNKPNKLKFDVGQGKKFKVTLPEFVDRESFFVLGVRRSGSTLLHQIIRMMCKFNQVPTFGLTKQAFNQNIPPEQWMKCSELTQVVRDGAAYIGFRSLPDFLLQSELFHNRRKILLVRDPRDTIVSGYFSIAYSHKVPDANQTNSDGLRESMLKKRELTQSQSIDQYSIDNAASLNSTISKYLQLVDSPNLKVYRYEDVVLDKRPWIKSMADFLDLEVSDKLLDRILKRLDVVPNQEQPDQHLRRVTPGDHKDKLQPETIAYLNEVFADFMKNFSY